MCVYVFMRAMQLGLQWWHFAYFVLLNLCTVSSERDSELLSPHHLSTSLFIPSVHSSPILQQLWLSFIGFFIFISANLCCWNVCANLLSEFSTSTVLCLRRLPFFLTMGKLRPQTKGSWKTMCSILTVGVWFCRCITSYNSKVLSTCPSKYESQNLKLKMSWALLKIYLSSKSDEDLENI